MPQTQEPVKRPSPLMAFNVRDVPRPLQRRFRELCENEGVTMRDKVLELMRQYVVAAARSPRQAP